MRIRIRNATPADADIIVTYNSLIASETEARDLDRAVLDAGVRQMLADENKGRYWLAEENGEPIGQIMVTYEWSDWRNGMLWWIQSVYIDAGFRRKGIFSMLYRHVESLAKADGGVCGLRLYVERNNRPAQQTYQALGMVEPGYQVMQALFEHESTVGITS
jgi:ribosomal protein S18 acetylase RimI-like enzyme